MKKLLALLLTLILIIPLTAVSYAPKIAVPNTTDPSQAKKFLKDRNASKELINCVDYIYDYCDEVGIDATLIIGISSIETGYGKSNLFRNYNNPGGMKARSGWMRFKSVKAGYKAMIDKIAVMAGVKMSSSYYYNTCVYIKDLGNIYWVENGCDKGYYNMLTKQMNTISSYKSDSKPKTKSKKYEQVIIDKPPEKQDEMTAQEYLMSFIKDKKKTGLELIYDAIGK